MPPMQAHRFIGASEDDSECVDCGVIVEDALVEVLMLECPISGCTDPTNHDMPCVLIAGVRGPECAYCGRLGDPHGEYDGSGDDEYDDELDDEDDVEFALDLDPEDMEQDDAERAEIEKILRSDE